MMRQFISLLIILFSANIVLGAKPATEPDPLDLSIDENIAVPEVPQRAKKHIAASVDQLRRQLIHNGLKVETLREGEVLQVVISCSELFAPCSTELKPSADGILKNLGFIVNEPDKFKVLVVVHSDNSGDAQYSDALTADRANAIDDYFWQLMGQKDTCIIPYGVGMDEPLTNNTTRADREINRRVEIFIIPNYGLLELAGVRRK